MENDLRGDGKWIPRHHFSNSNPRKVKISSTSSADILHGCFTPNFFNIPLFYFRADTWAQIILLITLQPNYFLETATISWKAAEKTTLAPFSRIQIPVVHLSADSEFLMSVGNFGWIKINCIPKDQE